MSGSGDFESFLLGVVRGVVVLVGIAVFAVGALVVFVPGMAGLLPVDSMISVLGSDYVVLATVGLVATAFAVLVLLVVAIRGVDQATLPVVESVESAPHPGQAVDRSVDGDARGDLPDSRIERLREAAVRTLVRAEHCTRSTAERRVAAGAWTDDEVAADFLAGGDDGLFRTAVSNEDRVRRTARAIARLDGSGATPDGESRTASGEPSAAAGDRLVGDTAGSDGDATDRRRDQTPDVSQDDQTRDVSQDDQTPDVSKESDPARSGAGTGGR